ncbi:hypothetical protein GS4_41_00310 [Gordonia soli NBRC 108243]|uniref:Uncharacterized protein n=1 Tax=Gordonia soli NBRC 108243 TaxID=1223545 RepID=M0QQ20_9ACTN|nr:hypothetical protein GS4_41_00310 [Gordonia soli NBRC 108243]
MAGTPFRLPELRGGSWSRVTCLVADRALSDVAVVEAVFGAAAPEPFDEPDPLEPDELVGADEVLPFDVEDERAEALSPASVSGEPLLPGS